MDPQNELEKGMLLIARAAQVPEVARKLRGSAEERKSVFDDAGLKDDDVKAAAEWIRDHYFKGENRPKELVNFW